MKTRLLLIIALLVLFPVIETLGGFLGTPPLVLLLAAAPAAALSAGALFLGRGSGEPRRLLLAVFFWGALVATFFSKYLNDLASLLVLDTAGAAAARVVVPMVAAPIVEELCKATALWLMLLVLQPRTFGVRGGMLYGALVGIGFAMTENVQYFLWAAVTGGPLGLGRAVYTRAVLSGLNHAVFSACAGAALGWAARTEARLATAVGVAAAGLSLAIVQHIVWNAFASGAINEILCNPFVSGGACRGDPDLRDLAIGAPLIELLFIAPGALLLWFARRYDEPTLAV
jgi:RsiW-degrading membrane proteinase PrsW (M82 family)